MDNDLERKLIALAEEQEALKDKLRENAEEIEKVLYGLGIGHTFQAGDGVVYQVCVPKGTFAYYKHIDYKRTNRIGEKSTTALSKTEAKSLGYDV